MSIPVAVSEAQFCCHSALDFRCLQVPKGHCQLCFRVPSVEESSTWKLFSAKAIQSWIPLGRCGTISWAQPMFKRLLKPALILLVVLVVCWVLISPAVDLEPGTLRSLQFVAIFAFLLGCLKLCILPPALDLQLHRLEPIQTSALAPTPPSASASCVLLC